MTATETHLDRLSAARKRAYSNEAVASIVEPTRTFPAHLVVSPYFFVGPRRPEPRQVIRLVCEREGRNPRRDEVMEYAGTATRIVGTTPQRGALRRLLGVTFTCHGTEDVVRSCCNVRDREN